MNIISVYWVITIYVEWMRGELFWVDLLTPVDKVSCRLEYCVQFVPTCYHSIEYCLYSCMHNCFLMSIVLCYVWHFFAVSLCVLGRFWDLIWD